jgi:hypothetical protein
MELVEAVCKFCALNDLINEAKRNGIKHLHVLQEGLVL